VPAFRRHPTVSAPSVVYQSSRHWPSTRRLWAFRSFKKRMRLVAPYNRAFIRLKILKSFGLPENRSDIKGRNIASQASGVGAIPFTRSSISATSPLLDRFFGAILGKRRLRLRLACLQIDRLHSVEIFWQGDLPAPNNLIDRPSFPFLARLRRAASPTSFLFIRVQRTSQRCRASSRSCQEETFHGLSITCQWRVRSLCAARAMPNQQPWKTVRKLQEMKGTGSRSGPSHTTMLTSTIRPAITPSALEMLPAFKRFSSYSLGWK
jgi:hypothetical protein